MSLCDLHVNNARLLTLSYSRTNRRFNQISSSFLFRSVHLFFPVSSLRLDSLSQYIFRPHWQYIHTLRTYTDGYISSEYENKKRQRTLVSFLRECKNLKSLGLYYYFGGTDLSYISNEVVRLLDQEVLEEVGIYSMTVLESNQPLGFLQSNPIGGIMDFVTALASHPGASRALKKFDIATESMYWEIYELIRKDFPNLTSLTVRHSFRRHLWDDNYSARIAWSPKYRLTRLQLVNCQTAYAPEIPFFLQIFESLEELTISTCGWVGDERPLQIREQGWSKEPGALCKMRRPLKWLKLEHMIDWEVKALGVIPTTELSLIHWNAAELIEPFKDDEELFPGLKVLRMHQRWIGDEEEKQDKQMKKSYGEVLLEICEKRGIELRRDAERMMICFCCSFEPADF